MRQPSLTRAVLLENERRSGKTRGRQMLVDRFGRGWRRSLSILTLPGAFWIFEKHLLAARAQLPPTRITSLEYDSMVYATAMFGIPFKQGGISHIAAHPSALSTVTTDMVHRYHQAWFEDFVAADTEVFDAAWIDFNGPLNSRSLWALKQLWARVEDVLVVTSLKSRWSKQMSRAVRRMGGVAPLVRGALPHSKIDDVYEYRDTVAMVQVTLTR